MREGLHHRGGWRSLRVICGVGVLVAVLIVVGCGGKSRTGKMAENHAAAGAKKADGTGGALGSELFGALEVSDFIFPERDGGSDERGCLPYREPLKRWEREQIERFWVPVDVLVEKALRRRSDQAMDRLFASGAEGTNRRR